MTALAPAQQGSILTQFSDLPQMLQVADTLCRSSIVPKRFSGDQGGTLIALDIAARMRTNPLMIMQNLYVVQGSPSFSGQFAIAAMRTCPKYKDFRFEYLNGKDYTAGMRVVGIRADGGPDDIGTAITPDMPAKFGWGPMWQKMPEQMYKYRAASWFVRTFCPEVLMGLPTTDELEDMPEAQGGMRNVTPAKKRGIAGAKPAAAPAAAMAPAAAEGSGVASKKDDGAQGETVEAQAAPADTAALGRLRAALKQSGVGIKTLYGILDAAGIARPEIGAAPDEFAAWAERLLADKDAVNVLDKNGVHIANDGKENA